MEVKKIINLLNHQISISIFYGDIPCIDPVYFLPTFYFPNNAPVLPTPGGFVLFGGGSCFFKGRFSGYQKPAGFFEIFIAKIAHGEY
jgi:hypothetical protein